MLLLLLNAPLRLLLTRKLLLPAALLLVQVPDLLLYLIHAVLQTRLLLAHGGKLPERLRVRL